MALETLFAIYVVSKEYGATAVRRHTLYSEASITLGNTRSDMRSGFHAELRRETWQGNEMIAWETLSA